MANDSLLGAALAAKALSTAQEALRLAQAAADRDAPVPLDVQALLSEMVRVIGSIALPAPSVSVAAAEAPQINVAAPVVDVRVDAAPPANVNFAPQILVDSMERAAPVVNVGGAVVNVEPTPVTVEGARVIVQMQPRKAWRVILGPLIAQPDGVMRRDYADIVPVEEVV